MLNLVSGKSYICRSYERKAKGFTWFEVAECINKPEEEFCFSAMCFFPKLSELDMVLEPEAIPESLWVPFSFGILTDGEPLLYTFKRDPKTVRAGRYHLRTSFPRYQGSSGPYVSGSPIVQIDKVIPLKALEQWFDNNKTGENNGKN